MLTLAHTWRTARKPQVCSLCGRRIDPGEKYLDQRNKSDYNDGVYTWRNCAHCDVLLGHLWNRGVDDDEGVNHDTVEWWEPETLGELRWKVCWRRGWRRNDGSLYDVPEGSRA